MNNFASKKAISVSLKPQDVCKQFPPKKKHKHKFQLHQNKLFLLEDLHLQQLLPAVKKGDAATDRFSDQIFGKVSWDMGNPLPWIRAGPTDSSVLAIPYQVKEEFLGSPCFVGQENTVVTKPHELLSWDLISRSWKVCVVFWDSL